MTRSAVDALIAGGGLSGLSLAAHLAARGWRDRSVLVVDDGATEPDTSFWASWSCDPGLLDGAVSRSFRQVRIHAGGMTRMVGLGRYRYLVVRRADLRRTVLGLIAGCPGFAVVPGHVDEVRDRGDAAEAIVDGRPVRAGWVFDSVTRPVESDVDARLAFTGYDLVSARPVFEPDTPVLFDFRSTAKTGARFVYIMPEDSRHALVELTEFVPRQYRPSTDAARRAALDTYLRDVLSVREHQIVRTESAVLGLTAHPRSRGRGRVVAIGAAGGMIKASTGYAYQRIQRDSDAIATSLARHGHPWGVPRGRARHRLLDALLLDVLAADASQLERAFARLFARNPAERVLRFLDEDTGLRDELRIIASMPPGPYLRALAGRLR